MGMLQKTRGLRLEIEGVLLDAIEEAELEYAPMAKADEHRYTLGPMYMPGVLDAHGEYAEAEDLFKAMLDFNLNPDRRELRKQHGSQAIGTVLSLFQWPYEQAVDLRQADGSVRKAIMPADTVYSGVQWSEQAWPDVKKGLITGYSMGGRAVRLRNQPVDGLTKLA